MGKTGELFKKIGDIKGAFHAKMGMIKDRNGKDLTETENWRHQRTEMDIIERKEIKKRWQECTEEL